MPSTTKPRTTARTMAAGQAATKAAAGKAHTAAFATKLAELKARQEGTTVEAQLPRAACIQYLQAHGAYAGHSRDSIDQLREAVAAHRAGNYCPPATSIIEPVPGRPAKPEATPEPEPATAAKPAALTYYGAGKDRQGGLSAVAYDCTRDLLGDGAPRVTTTAFRAWLAEHGVADPQAGPWELALPNGKVVGARTT